MTANDGADFLRAARALSLHFPPIQRVEDVSEQIEDLSDIPDADIDRMKAIRDAARWTLHRVHRRSAAFHEFHHAASVAHPLLTTARNVAHSHRAASLVNPAPNAPTAPRDHRQAHDEAPLEASTPAAPVG